MKKSQKVLIALGITASILAGGGSFSQGKKETDNLKDTKKKELAGNLETPKQEKIDPRFIGKNDISKNNNNIKNDGKNKLKSTLEQDEFSHHAIIKMKFEDILKIYGKEKGMEIIRKHFLEEINNKRYQLGNSPLKLNNIISQLAQYQAQYMAANNHYNHTDENGKSASDKMMEDGRYNYKMYASNISFNISQIFEVVQSYINNNKWETGHYDVISTREYEDLGVGLAKSKNETRFIVVNYGQQLKKK